MGIEEGGVKVNVTKGDCLSTGFKDGQGYITYIEKHHFFRLLGLFVQNYNGEDFCVNEKVNFDTLSLMLDVSAAVPVKVPALKEYMRYMAIMGYNQLQLYIEDMYEIPERPYFGYLRGRYTKQELKECDDYGFDLGIEVVPCMQTLGHMAHYLRWGREAGEVKESRDLLLPGEEKTYEFIEQMIKNASEPFRTKKIHIGLDETDGLGLGQYLKRHGYTEPLDIFINHLKRVYDITQKYGLEPMMWSDMLINLSGGWRLDKDARFSDKVLKELPEKMKLVYWQYGEVLDIDAPMIDEHKKATDNLMFAGGVWIWTGLLPDNIFSALGSEISLKVCKEKNVREVMLTVWTYTSTSTYFTSLLEMQRYAEHAYNDEVTNLKERFEFCTGASYDAFIRMSDYYALYSEGEVDYDSKHYYQRFRGEHYTWQDIMVGIAEEQLYTEPRSRHYADARDFYIPYMEKNDKWFKLYEYCYNIFDFLSHKCYLAENLAPAYKRGDREFLEKAASEYLPTLLEKVENAHMSHRYFKEVQLKAFGYEIMDNRFGGLKERCKMSKRRIEQYLNGEVDCLEELEAERLPFPSGPWGFGYANLATI